MVVFCCKNNLKASLTGKLFALCLQTLPATYSASVLKMGLQLANVCFEGGAQCRGHFVIKSY